jgi:hypothetical protein
MSIAFADLYLCSLTLYVRAYSSSMSSLSFEALGVVCNIGK